MQNTGMADGIDGEVSCLSFFTADHQKHGAQWRMPGSSCPVVCVACLVEILELKDVLLIQKRKVVGEMASLLSRADTEFAKLLTENPRVTSHLCSILLNLLRENNELLVSLAIELVQEIACKVPCENLIDDIVNSLETSVTQGGNVRMSCPHISLIGRLLDNFASLANSVARRSDFLEFLLVNLAFPDEKIQATILFVMAAVCKTETTVSLLKSDFKRRLLAACCDILSSSKSRNIQLNSLAVMKRIVKEIVSQLSTDSSDRNGFRFARALKKVLLCADETLRIVSTQLVCDVLAQDLSGSHAKELLKHGIGEFLFEGLETNNEVVLGSLFCCFSHLCKTEAFFDGGFSLYGIESVILGLNNALRLKNMAVIRKGLEVLTLVLARQPHAIPLFHAKPALFDGCISILQEAFKSPEHKVLIQAIQALEQLMQVQHMPPIPPLPDLVAVLSTMVDLLKRFLKPISSFRNIQAAVAQELLLSLLKTIKRAFQFTEEYEKRVPSYASLLADSQCSSRSDGPALGGMSSFLMNSLDKFCIPVIMINFDEVENPEIFENVCIILNNRISSGASAGSELAEKLLSSSFLRVCLEVSSKFCQCQGSKELSLQISSLVRQLVLVTCESTERDQVQEIVDLTPKEFPKSAGACVMLLSQQSMHPKTGEVSDQVLFNTQCLCIEILYAAFKNHDMLLTEATLMKTLDQYLTIHPGISHLPIITQKHLVCLYVQCVNKLRERPKSASSESGDLYASSDILSQTLADVSLDEFERIVTIDTSFLEWVFSSEVLAVKFGHFMLLNWLKMGQSSLALHSLLQRNPFCFQALLSLLMSSEPCTVNNGLEVLEGLFDNKTNGVGDLLGGSFRKCVMDCFHKLLLGHLEGRQISSIVRILTAILMKSGELEVKLVHHIVNNITQTEASPEIILPCLNFLNVLLQEILKKGQTSVGSFLLAKKTVYECLQYILDDIKKVFTGPRHERRDVNIYSSALSLVGQLITWQTLPTPPHVFRLPKEDLIQLLHKNASVMGIAALVFWKCIFDAMIKKQDHAFVFTKGQDTTLLTPNDLQAILVFIQNFLVHESEMVRQIAILCLEGLLQSADKPILYAGNPWNRIVLESQLTVLDSKTLQPSFLMFASLLIQHSSQKQGSVLEASISTILERIPSVQPEDQETTWSSMTLLKEIVNKIGTLHLVASQRKSITEWLKGTDDSLCEQDSDLPENDGYLMIDRTLFSSAMVRVRIPKDRQLVSYLVGGLKSDI